MGPCLIYPYSRPQGPALPVQQPTLKGKTRGSCELCFAVIHQTGSKWVAVTFGPISPEATKDKKSLGVIRGVGCCGASLSS